ncbi:hypothetical protein AC481_04375 [miscellaneous Crenarchaeota group archaeon SMTZ-80]|nr:MAG: hypothetical protein AC481_04375 [miscellaneous Crenarchaeota group archaeon SMTZ-80]
MDSIGAMIQGVFLITTYFFLILNAIQVIIRQSYIVSNPNFGFQILIISFLINIIFSRILISQGKKRKIVLVSFVLVIFFNITFLDPLFSIILSIWIIFSSAFLLKKGIKIRASGDELFIDVRLSVEDHISIIHANEITKAISSMSKSYFPPYQVESIIEMNPLSGEISIGDKIINLLHSMKAEFNEILKFKDLNVFRIESDYFLSISIVVDENLSLKKAHDISNNFEQELKKEEPQISRIITHIESGALTEKLSTKQLTCKRFNQDELNSIQKRIEKILRTQPEVKGYHGFEFWSTTDFCVLELHIFFDDNLNISYVHDIITGLEQKVIEELDIEELNQVVFHSEPLKGRTDGILFKN